MPDELKRELYELLRADFRVFEFLQDGSHGGLWYWDLEDSGRGWKSPQLRRQLGLTEADAKEMSWWRDYIFKSDLKRAESMAAAHCEDPQIPYEVEIRYTTKAGKVIWHRDRGVAVRDAFGKPIRMVGCYEDITMLRELQREVGFPVDLARELKAPLARIRKAAAGLIEDDLPDDARETLRTVRHDAQSILEVVNELVALSDDPQESLSPQTVDVDALLSAQLDDALLTRLKQQHIPPVTADPSLLVAILQTMVRVAATDRGEVSVTGVSQDDQVQIVVEGEATHEHVEYLFDPLQQTALSSLKDSLAVAAARRNAGKLGGTLIAVGRPHLRFVLTLPAAA